ncbi:MAG: SDR family NAD(P)-dependent oxidoreductase [Hydrogenophaga sp.]|jgi:NAD(P)-dependent dehydrogenase (short-subunit alcohol dehydrogenase family)|uniref:SDR family NAD(P)-dependent oxidoreductase n=1 Tax=Hydrogenophaga sp. TaxID=1904254 RepID=UPI0027172A71|nr:SDR family NAD(P)-dependent oxidoreductase [Hydrogenophaga sp.]MDO9504398.1 SDR family NAD(P)-dependent oxidoreductase [Hydrogenophaga sp.]MDP3205973.1 SDR family NAD(P)-dependent oxidoreductase [Hydrogenophaga sp.]MDP3628668.1 SDR family NAD(P)-dependent oxidoreductase [Hydrogenophaga sp.]
MTLAPQSDHSHETQGLAVVIGGTGGIGAALVAGLKAQGFEVLSLGRSTQPALDYTDEKTVANCAQHVADCMAQTGLPLQRMIVATGFLHGDTARGQHAEPERSWQHLNTDALQHNFLINAVGPALVMRHFLPLLPKQGRSVAAFLSARVGSIGDNALGGWYAYRASKAALNQLVHTSAIELARRNKEALCVALHPGTVDTGLSQPFAKTGLQVRPAQEAASDLLAVIDALPAGSSGQFFDHKGLSIPW